MIAGFDFVIVTVVVTAPTVTVVRPPGMTLLPPPANVMVIVDPGSVTVEIHVTVSGMHVPPPPARTCPTLPRKRVSSKLKVRMFKCEGRGG